MSSIDLSISSTAARRAVQRADGKQTTANMPPENKGVGWRKKIQNKPKELQPLKVSADDAISSGRHLFSRKGIHGSRPATPATPATPAIEETDKGQSERTQCITPRRSSKPKLVRYTSLFTSFKDIPEPKSPEFAEPWSAIDPALTIDNPYLDPIVTIQAIRSHMMTFPTTPLSPKHNNGLFCVFEHYYKLRTENESMEIELQQARQSQKTTQDRWIDEESRYAEEIRRLELLIARGATGVAGFVLGDRIRSYLADFKPEFYMPDIAVWFLTQEQIDTEIKSRSQNGPYMNTYNQCIIGASIKVVFLLTILVLLQRSTSPSGKMTVLSRQLTGGAGAADLCVGTPPTDDRKPMLSLNAHSGLDLTKLANTNIAKSVASSSFNSGFRGGAGDTLPDEMSQALPVPVELGADSDAFFALRELGTLVARRRGLNTTTFVDKLMMLFSEAEQAESHTKNIDQPKPQDYPTGSMEVHVGETTPIRALRHFQSQPQLDSDTTRHRHFSFEPGEDRLQALQGEVTSTPSARLNEPSTFGYPDSVTFLRTGSTSSSEDLDSPYQVPCSDPQNLSKIPTPVLHFGCLRRPTSLSSLQLTRTTSHEGRHNSQSSILTAFRDTQNGALRPGLSSRSSSVNNLCDTDNSLSSTGRISSAHVRNSAPVCNSVTNSTATRAGELANSMASPKDGSPARDNQRTFTTGLSSRANRHPGLMESDKTDRAKALELNEFYIQLSSMMDE